MAELLRLIELLRGLAPYLENAKVLAVIFVLYMVGSMIYVAVSCRNYSQAKKREMSRKHDGSKRRHAVFTDEHSL